MKHLLYILVLASVLFTSCEMNSSDNGKLDNIWYLVKLDSISNGKKAIDYRSQHIFWSFQGSLMQTNCVDSMNQFIMYRFDATDKQLIVKSPFIYDRVDDDQQITDETVHMIKLYGINAITDTFQIEKLNSTTMILRDDSLRLYFDRW